MTIFKYTTIAALRKQSISERDLSDDDARQAIEDASNQINEVTEQWFAPHARQLDLDGNGGYLAMAPIPILKIFKIKVLAERSQAPGIARVGAVEPSAVLGYPSELPRFDDRQSVKINPFTPTQGPDYTVSDRKIRSTTSFPMGLDNIQATGVFGWLDDVSSVETTLAVDLLAGSGVSGTPAVSPGANATFNAIVNGDTLSLTVDGGQSQTITFQTGDTTIAAAEARINSQIKGASAVINGAQIDLVSDSSGVASEINVTGGTGVAKLGQVVGVFNGMGGGALTCTLTDATGVRPGHVLTFMSGTPEQSKTEYTAWVKSVSGNVVTFVDPCVDLLATLPATTTRVADYGRPPALIQRACMLIVNQLRFTIGNPQLNPQDFLDRLKGERTDNYSYSLKPTAEILGDTPLNTILNRYMKPPFMSMV